MIYQLLEFLFSFAHVSIIVMLAGYLPLPVLLSYLADVSNPPWN